MFNPLIFSKSSIQQFDNCPAAPTKLDKAADILPCLFLSLSENAVQARNWLRYGSGGKVGGFSAFTLEIRI
jgi:hypothetical protein